MQPAAGAPPSLWFNDPFLSGEMFDSSPDALLLIRSDGVIVFASAAVERLFGYNKNEIQGKELEMLLPERYRASHAKLRLQFNVQPRIRHMGVGLQLFGCRKDGSEFPVDVSLGPLRSSAFKDTATLTFAAVRDVTEQKQVEKQRTEAVEMLARQEQESIDTVCHELRSPLLGIFGTVTFLKECLAALSTSSPVTPELLCSMREHVATIEQCAQQQRDLVDEVLDPSRSKIRGAELLHPEQVDIMALLLSIRRLFALQLHSKHLELRFHVVPDPLTVFVDRKRLFQVVTNLISNAIKFTHQGAVVVKAFLDPAKSSDESPHLRVSIEDSGIGMSSEQVAKLFHRYVQVTSDIATKYGGSGLGLAISKRLVELMGGTISVESEKGRGTKVDFSVITSEPLSKQQGCESSAAQQPVKRHASFVQQHHRALNVLIAEDNLVNQRIISKFVERAGHSPFIANNGAEAVHMCSAMAFDLIFMDIEMPIMGGYEATRKIRELERNASPLRRIPIIGVSGNARQQRIDEALDAGVDDYLTKPFLEAQVREMLARFSCK